MSAHARHRPAVLVVCSLVFGLLGSGCGRPAPSGHDAEVVEARHPKLTGGEHCEVHIRDAYKFGLNCRINVMCGGVQLYGGKRLGGYALCELDADDHAARSLEENISREDGDPAIDLDVAAGTVRVWDKRWSVSARLVRDRVIGPVAGR